MEERYHDTESLGAELADYERRFGLSSEELAKRYRVRQLPREIPAEDAFAWVDIYTEVERIRAASRRNRAALQSAA